MSARAAVAKVQIARKELGLDEDTYRAVLARLTGKSSASDCTDAELGQVLDEFKAKSWTPRKAAAPAGRQVRKPADSSVARKARALWISLHQLGVVNDPSEPALEAFARRQLGVDRLAWAVPSHAHGLIEALKAMAARAGWAQDGDPSVIELKARLVEAQWRALVGLGVVPDLKGDDMLQWLRVRRIVPEVPELTSVTAEHLDKVSQSMGARIWRAKADQGGGHG